MNKISKKIVALATMAAFVLTLVPAAAFGASTDSKYTVKAVDYNTATVSIDLGSIDESTFAGGNILVWAEDSKGDVLEYGVEATYSGEKVVPTYATDGFDGAFVGQLEDQTVDITFAKAGDYKIFVALNQSAANIGEAKANQVNCDNSNAFYAWPAVSEQSKYGVIKNDQVQAEATVAVDTDLETTFYINDKDGIATGDVLENVFVWAVNDKGEVTGLSKVTPVDGKATYVGSEPVGAGSDRYAYELTNVANGAKVNVQFDAAGTYTLYAGVGTSYDVAKDATLNEKDVNTVVTVTDDSEITYLDLKAKVNGVNQTLDLDEDTDTYTLDLTELTGTDFAFDGNDEIDIEGVAYVGDKEAVNKTINFKTTAPKSVVEFWDTDNSTGNDGKFGTTITMQDKQNALISITDSEGNVEYTLRIVALKTTATNIDRTLTGGYVLAGTDEDYAADVYGNGQVKFDGAVEFEITDQKGNPVTSDNLGETVVVKGKPGKSTLDDNDLSLVSLGNGKYTLAYENKAGAGYASDLVEGEYTVRVSLPSEDNATVTFTAAEFGKIEDVQIDLTANGNVKLDDEVMLGDVVNVGLFYVDGNGIKVPYNGNFNWNVKNSAHAVIAAPNFLDKTFILKADSIEHQGVIGSEVTVQVAVPDFGLVEKTLTIVDSYNVYSLEFDPTEGPVNEYNTVDVTVLEDDGDEARVNGTVDAILVDSSNEDAKVSVEVKNNKLVIYSDQETVLDIVVTVNNGNEIIAAGTLEYTVGNEAPLANRTVVMTIDSTEYVVNNNIIKGDAAPYIDSNWRTMVPIRALMEAFDAEVIWDEANPDVVTINYDADTQIVMNVGETGYTINGEEGDMDTVPVNNNGRVYVPIRFVAEGIGFNVLPLYDSNGLTASVVFQK